MPVGTGMTDVSLPNPGPKLGIGHPGFPSLHIDKKDDCSCCHVEPKVDAEAVRFDSGPRQHSNGHPAEPIPNTDRDVGFPYWLGRDFLHLLRDRRADQAPLAA